MKGFIEVYDTDARANVLVSIASIIQVLPIAGGTRLLLAVQNANSMPYVVGTSDSYVEVKTMIEAAQ